MTDKSKSPMPKGGRKGGTIFPRIDLSQAVVLSKKLVAKTHTSTQNETALLAGVFGLGDKGKIKISALKQFGLMEGDSKAYTASKLAKNLASSPPEDIGELLQEACMMPSIFKKLYEAFQNGDASVSRIRQLAMQHKVHIESAEQCVSLFLSSLTTAGLCVQEGDTVTIGLIKQSVSQGDDSDELLTSSEMEESDEEKMGNNAKDNFPEHRLPENRRPNGFQVSISIDPTMDPEKLEKHLNVLRRYGIC
ncbi:hypothetical protein [Luteolibacter sp. LG18]|uniref:hypothetical protein n=1 Tax=Luteolibacter sp. LG18 TaxID=2819286 RepID=UPI002B29787D|nr:hypothetical protein llg_37970 [Luteolibacter sp. LG18]